MSLLPASFDGSILEIQDYQLSVIDTSIIYRVLLANRDQIESEFQVRWDETEELFAWCVVHCIRLAFPEIHVLGSYHHNVYREIYDEFFRGYDSTLRTQILPAIQDKTVKTIRVLPLLNKSLIALGT